MAKFQCVGGTNSKTVKLFIQNNTSTTGAGLTGLAYNTASLTCYYIREGASSTTLVSLVTATLGAYTSSGFVVCDSTNMPGVYEFGIPNLAIASGAKSVAFYLQGAASMAPCIFEVEITAVDNQTGTNFGLTALPTANPAASGGLVTCDSTNSVKIQNAIKKNTALNNFEFVMLNSSGAAVTGATITSTVSIDGGAFVSTTNSASEISTGAYKINLAAADLNGNNILFIFAASGAQNTYVPLTTSP